MPILSSLRPNDEDKKDQRRRGLFDGPSDSKAKLKAMNNKNR